MASTKNEGFKLPDVGTKGGEVLGDIQQAKSIPGPIRRIGEQVQIFNLAREYDPKADAQSEAKRIVDDAIITAAFKLDQIAIAKYGKSATRILT